MLPVGLHRGLFKARASNKGIINSNVVTRRALKKGEGVDQGVDQDMGSGAAQSHYRLILVLFKLRFHLWLSI